MADEPGCSESLHELYTFLDGELTVERRHSIERHLEACSPCGERYDFEAELRIVVRERCREQVPESLKQRVFDAIRELEGGGGAF